MPDFEMCINTDCKLKQSCKRSPMSGTEPDGSRQSWGNNHPYEVLKNGKHERWECISYLEVKK